MEIKNRRKGSGILLNLEVQPSKGLGHLYLGQPINDVMKVLSRLKPNVPRVEFKYLKTNPLERDMVFHFPENGIHLQFDPISQKLNLIEIFDFSRIELHYQGSTFRSAKILPTFLQIYNSFGPTYPGEYDPKLKHYLLSYPGVSFVFPIPDQHANLYTQKNEKAQLPIEFPDGKTPVCTRMYLYQGKSLSQISPSPTVALDKFRSLRFYYEIVTVRPQIGIFFEMRKVMLYYGMDCQDVIALLGTPNSVYYKRDHKMLIHASTIDGRGLNQGEIQDYFFNYYDYGVDVLFDTNTHTVKRILLHTNIPGQLHFSHYRKCNFRILTNEPAPSNTSNGVIENHLLDAREYDPNTLVTCDSRWSDVQRILGKPLGDPVISNRGTSFSPFGSTRFFGYSNLIFEFT